MSRLFLFFSIFIATNTLFADSTTIETINLDPTACFQDSTQICYQPPLRRGRTLAGIYEPEKFKPLVEISSPTELDRKSVV